MNDCQTDTSIEFFTYPPIGGEDWRYAYPAAVVRCLETQLLTRNQFLDMAGAPRFEDAVETLNNTDYAPGQPVKQYSRFEEILLEKRNEIRTLYVDLMIDEKLVELLRAREDYRNMRLAVRRVVTDRPIGTDYSPWGAVPAEEFEEIFETENYERFPDYLQDAVEAAILGYYENKDIRRIDYEIDRYLNDYRIKAAAESGSQFLCSLFRLRADLYNIRTLLRLKAADDPRRDLFHHGGFVEVAKFVAALDVTLDQVPQIFTGTPFQEQIARGTDYFRREESFLGLERECDDYELGFLKTAMMVTAGPQPVIAYTLMKEYEIRTLRMVLSGKFNGLEGRLITDRLPENL